MISNGKFYYEMFCLASGEDWDAWEELDESTRQNWERFADALIDEVRREY